MFKGSKIEYVGTRKFESEQNYRYADLTIKANSEEEVDFLFNNLISYLKENITVDFTITDCPTIEDVNGIVTYEESISIYDKSEYDELKELYKEWKKIAKTLVMPLEETQTIETETVEATITEASVCTPVVVTEEVIRIESIDNSDTEINKSEKVNSTVTDQGDSATNFKNTEIKNSNATITDDTIQTGEISKIENDKVTITERQKSLEQIQDLAITECHNWGNIEDFDSLEVNDIILYDIGMNYSYWIKGVIYDMTADKNTIWIEAEKDIYKIEITDIDKVKVKNLET